MKGTTTHLTRATSHVGEPAGEHTLALHVKQQLAAQVWQAMQAQRMTKAEMARRMGTTRRVLDRLLDAGNAGVTLLTLSSAAHALGSRIDLQLVAHAAPAPHYRDAP